MPRLDLFPFLTSYEPEQVEKSPSLYFKNLEAKPTTELTHLEKLCLEHRDLKEPLPSPFDEFNSIFEIIKKRKVKQFHNYVNTEPMSLFVETINGDTPLHKSVQQGSVEMVNMIISCLSRIKGNLTELPYDLLNKQNRINGYTPLHVACSVGSVYCAKILITNNVALHIPDNNKMLPIHLAAETGTQEIVEAILKAGQNVDVLGGHMLYSPLHFAMAKNNCNVAQMLLENGANPYSVGINEQMPIHVASKNGHFQCVKILVDYCKRNGLTTEKLMTSKDKDSNRPIHSAVYSGDINTIKAVGRFGAIQAMNDGTTALHIAASQGNVASLTALGDILQSMSFIQSLNAKDDVGFTPLHKAALADQFDTVTFLISSGADINATDVRLRTPLMCAAAHGHWNCIRLLLEKGANVQLRDNKNRHYLHHSTRFRDHILELTEIKQDFYPLNKSIIQNVAALGEFLKNSAKNTLVKSIINEGDMNGNTPLHVAARIGDYETVNKLVQLGSHITSKNKSHQCPFFLAASKGHFDICKFLMDSGKAALIKNVVDSDGVSVLHIAATNGHHKIVRLLVERNAYVGRDRDMNTAIHCAAQNGWAQCVALFKSMRKVLSSTNKDHNTPLHLAAEYGHIEVIKILLDFNVTLIPNEASENFMDIILKNRNDQAALVAINHQRWEEILELPSFYYESTFVGIIRSCPSVALRVLDRCVTYSNLHPKNKMYKISYNFRYLECQADKTRSNELEETPTFFKNVWSILCKKEETPKSTALPPFFALQEMINNDMVKCLYHEVCLQFLQLKWKSYGQYMYFARLVLYMTYVMVLTYSVLRINYQSSAVLHEPLSPHDRYVLSLTVKEKLSLEYFKNTVDPIFFRFLFIYSVISLLVRFFRTKVDWMSVTSYFEWILYISCSVYCFPFLTKNTAEIPFSPRKRESIDNYHLVFWQFGSVAIFTAWFNILVILQGFDVMGFYAVMFLTVFESLLSALMMICIPITSFALAFHFVNSMSPTGGYSTFWISAVRTFVMLSEGEYLEFLIWPCTDGDDRTLPFCNMSLMYTSLYILFIPTLLLSLVVGMACGDVKSVEEETKMKRVSDRVELLHTMESSMPNVYREQKKILTYVAFPNRTVNLSLYGKIRRFLFSLMDDEETKEENKNKISPTERPTLNNKERIEALLFHVQRNNDMLKKLVLSMSLDDKVKQTILKNIEGQIQMFDSQHQLQE